jgi:hypothetical protein
MTKLPYEIGNTGVKRVNVRKVLAIILTILIFSAVWNFGIMRNLGSPSAVRPTDTADSPISDPKIAEVIQNNPQFAEELKKNPQLAEIAKNHPDLVERAKNNPNLVDFARQHPELAKRYMSMFGQ